MYGDHVRPCFTGAEEVGQVVPRRVLEVREDVRVAQLEERVDLQHVVLQLRARRQCADVHELGGAGSPGRREMEGAECRRRRITEIAPCVRGTWRAHGTARPSSVRPWLAVGAGAPESACVDDVPKQEFGKLQVALRALVHALPLWRAKLFPLAHPEIGASKLKSRPRPRPHRAFVHLRRFTRSMTRS
jgi:hypothetical protein